MTFNKLMKDMDNGAVSYFIYKGEFLEFQDLPEIPKGYFLPIANFDLISDEICKYVIEKLKIENSELDVKYSKEQQESNHPDYSADCFFIALNLGQFFDFWHGKLPYIENQNLECEYWFLLDKFWDCLRGECTYDELKKYSNKFYNFYLKVTGKDGE